MRTLKSSSGFLVAAMMLALMVSPASAAIIDGTVNFSGSVTVTDTTIVFGPSSITDPQSGSFLPLSVGDAVTVLPLDSAGGQPVGVGGLSYVDFVTFATSAITFQLDFISPGTGTALACGSGGPCTPAGSPFTLVNVGTGSTATFAVSGIVNDGIGPDSNWSGIFTAQFADPFEIVLATLATAGSVQTSYSATLTATSVPEPSTGLMLLGAGLLGLAAVRRRRA